MNPANCALASGLVSPTYVQQGQQALSARSNLIKSLLSLRKMPLNGWDDATIEMLLQVSTAMSSNTELQRHLHGQRAEHVEGPHASLVCAGCSLHGQQQFPG